MNMNRLFLLMFFALTSSVACNLSALNSLNNTSCDEQNVETLFADHSRILGSNWSEWEPRCEPDSEVTRQPIDVQSVWIIGTTHESGLNIGTRQTIIFYQKEESANEDYPAVEHVVFSRLEAPQAPFVDLVPPIDLEAETSRVACSGTTTGPFRLTCVATMLHGDRVTYIEGTLVWNNINYIPENTFVELVQDVDMRAANYSQ
jgi:hypothetical protein